jgi:hypothetical protein
VGEEGAVDLYFSRYTTMRKEPKNMQNSSSPPLIIWHTAICP